MMQKQPTMIELGPIYVRIYLIPILFVAACAEFPQLDAVVDPAVYNTPAPAFLTDAQKRRAAEVPEDQNEEDALLARAEALQRRAERLRRLQIEP